MRDVASRNAPHGIAQWATWHLTMGRVASHGRPDLPTPASPDGRNRPCRVECRARGRYPRRMSLVRRLVVVATLLFGATPALGAGLQVEPGLWEFTSSLPDPRGGDSGKQVYRTCVRDRTITPERVMAQRKECRIWNAVVVGPSAKWKMRCETPAGPMIGSGSLRSNGSAVAGTLAMSMAVGSFEIPLTGEFRGRRVGACR